MSRCSFCGHDILWATNPTGRRIPFDPKPDPNAGYWVLTPSPSGMTARCLPYGPELQRAMKRGTDLHMPHDCPARNPRY